MELPLVLRARGRVDQCNALIYLVLVFRVGVRFLVFRLVQQVKVPPLLRELRHRVRPRHRRAHHLDLLLLPALLLRVLGNHFALRLCRLLLLNRIVRLVEILHSRELHLLSRLLPHLVEAAGSVIIQIFKACDIRFRTQVIVVFICFCPLLLSLLKLVGKEFFLSFQCLSRSEFFACLRGQSIFEKVRGRVLHLSLLPKLVLL